MIQSNRNKNLYLYILLGVYFSVLVYFMFFGFGRPQLSLTHHEYRYWLVPDSIPLWLPKHFTLDILKLWIFALGNLLAFIPFGILVPMVFKNFIHTYLKFVILFILFIGCMEMLQMITYLGSFDVTDIMVNTMGATIGYFSYKFSNRMNSSGKKLFVMLLTILGLSIVMFLIAFIYNHFIQLFF